MPSRSRATVVLAQFSASELQAGVNISIPHKVKIPHPAPGQRDYKIVPIERHIAGTRIPASTLAKFKSGEWKPSSKTLAKLRAFSGRVNYHRLRAVGASPAEASRHRREPPQALQATIDKYIKTVLTIASNKNVSPIFVAWGCAHSWRLSEDWDAYCQDQDYSVPEFDYDEWQEGYGEGEGEEEEEEEP